MLSGSGGVPVIYNRSMLEFLPFATLSYLMRFSSYMVIFIFRDNSQLLFRISIGNRMGPSKIKD